MTQRPSNEREALVALNLVRDMGAVTARRLKERFGSYRSAFEAAESELAEVPGIGPRRAHALFEGMASVAWEAELARAERMQVRLITSADPDYPKLLLEIADPPLALYCRGEIASAHAPCVALIGTRRATAYGRSIALRLAQQLAEAGCTVVSGLALGIDAEAHLGAVQAGGRTIGVLGGALDCFYPSENLDLAKRMVEGGGAVICEYPFGRSPDRQTFPMRNRIVSGLCRGVVAVEAPSGSGTMITVRQALEQNRTVLAVPGRIDSPASQGCNRLIRDGARMVTCVEDVIDEIDDLFATMRREDRRIEERPSPQVCKTAGGETNDASEPKSVGVAPKGLKIEEQKVLDLLPAEGLSLDELVRTSGLGAGAVGAMVIGLRIRKLVEQLPNGRIVRI